MKISLLLLFCFLSIIVYSQKWCPPGAEWTYGWGSWGVLGYEKIVYDQDVIINGQACKKLIGKGVNYSGGLPEPVYFDYPEPIYTYAQNDTVFIYHDNAFRATYFFNAQIGDTLAFGTIYCPLDPDLIQVVDTIGIIVLNNEPLRFYKVKYLNNISMIISKPTTTIIERFGAIDNYIYPDYFCHTDGQGWDLCNYKDDEFGSYYTSNDTCWYFTSTNDLFDQSLIITPNPATTNLNITSSFNDHIESVSIIDMSGVLINNIKRSYALDISIIDIEYLLNGIYILQIQTSDGNRYIRKFVKKDNK